MPAYLVVEIEVTDKEAYERDYRPTAQAVLAKLGGGGRIIIRGGRDGVGATESLEGGWMPERFVVVEFPDLDKAKAFYFSKEYQAALKLRQGSARSKAIFVEGV
jgi:uncharacterized protein (DUF1330 family)